MYDFIAFHCSGVFHPAGDGQRVAVGNTGLLRLEVAQFEGGVAQSVAERIKFAVYTGKCV